MFYAIIALVLLALTTLFVRPVFARRFRAVSVPVSVNYHFTRKCNASCGFCFHTEKTSFVRSEEEAKRGVAMLKQAGMRKINFAGGEPFLYRKFLASLLAYCKTELALESVSIVSNGSKIDEKFLRDNARYIDILAISCDSFSRQTNIDIGRTDHGRDYNNTEKLFRIAEWCARYGIKFKLNTVVCSLNFEEDMSDHIARLNPFRWKVFQVLMVAGENDSEQTKRDARKFQISDAQFQYFCSRHEHIQCFVPESNRVMKSSYLILDEYMRFLDKDHETSSPSILDVGVAEALSRVTWDEDAFVERGGIYDWTRIDGPAASKGCKTNLSSDLEF